MRKNLTRRTLIESFMKNVYPEPNTGCWLYDGALNKKGYGNTAKTINGKGSYLIRGTHRISYFLFNGEFNYSLCVCHSCDNPTCVNPDHLFLGTIEDNTKDMVKKGRSSKGTDRPTCKLTELQVVEIREKYKTGNYTHRSLAKEYGLDYGNVRKIIVKETWKHI